MRLVDIQRVRVPKTFLPIDMQVRHTEFGDFEIEETSGYRDLFIRKDTTSIHLGYIRSDWYDPDTNMVITYAINKVIDAYLIALRFESKVGMFGNIPLNNPFKDAVLRMQIEQMGQTLEVRKFIEEYDSTHSWIVYPREAEFYDVNQLRQTHDFVFSTPYGRYSVIQTGTYTHRMERLREGSTSVMADIGTPYAEIQLDLVNGSFLHAAETIYTDTQDTINKKTIEVGKRTAEAIKYLFGYDKLRRALRNRGTE